MRIDQLNPGDRFQDAYGFTAEIVSPHSLTPGAVHCVDRFGLPVSYWPEAQVIRIDYPQPKGGDA